MSIQTYTIVSEAPPPEVEIIFGHANWGSYQVYLYDNEGKNPVQISGGVNTDEIPDRSIIPSPTSLNNKMLYWRLRTAKFDGSQDGRFYMKVVVSQAGVDPYVAEYEGEFSNLTQDAVGIIRFIVA